MSSTQTSEEIEQIRLIIASETEVELRRLATKYADRYSQLLDHRKDVVTDAILGHLFEPLTLLFSDKKKRTKAFAKALRSPEPFDICDLQEELRAYYHERKDTLQLLYQKTGIPGEFPDIPFYVAAYGTNTPLLHRNTHQLWGILVWGLDEFWRSRRDRATATRMHFFPETEAICPVPGIFAESLCEQTVQLWGASPEKVYNTRCGLLIDRVLPAAFEWLKQWLPASSDSSYLEHEYRELTRAICEELDNLAKRLTNCLPMDAYQTRFSDEKYQKRVTEKTQKGKESATAVLDVLEQEFAYIHLRYKVVIQ